MKLGPFPLLAQIAASADGVAYQSLDPRDNQPLELRVLSGARGDSDGWARRIKRLRLAAMVDHPAARRVRAMRLHLQPFYVAVEGLEGSSLARELAGSLPLPVPQAVAWGRGLATALAAGHRMGLVQERLAPGTLRCATGRVPKVDFTGVVIESEANDNTVFDELFRAPELTRSSVPDFAGDVYSLGCLLCWFLSDDAPRVRSGSETQLPEALAAHLRQWDSEQAGALEKLLREMVAIDPVLRPTAREVEERLAGLMPSGKPRPPLLEKTNLVPLESVAVPEAPPSSAEGTRDRLGRFRMLEKLGEGGMGEVWRAEDPGDGTSVAVKVLRPDWARRPAALRRFQKEARLLGEVNHPNVAHLLELNEDNGIHFLVLEFVAGRSLDKVLAERKQLDERTSLAIIADVARALEDAHRRSIVHRDIKPGNIVLLDGGAGEFDLPRVKLLDFGLARHVVESESLNITEAGTLLGTPLYVAPEQGFGQGADARADVYSLGATLFHLLAGRPPFEADSALGLLAAHATDAPPLLRQLVPTVSEGVGQVVSKCLAKQPDGRYPDAGALLRDLERLLRGEPTHINIHPKLPPCDPRKVFQFDWSWDLQASPAQLWPHVSNTERLNRAAGLPAVEYKTEGEERGGSKRFGQFKKAGVMNVWREHPFEWVEGRRLGVVREYSQGVLRWLVSIVEMEPLPGGGTRLTHRVRVEPRNWLGKIVAYIEVGKRGRKSLEKVYRHIDDYVCNRLGDPAVADAFEPTAALAWRIRRRMQRVLDQLIQEKIDPAVVERLGEYLAAAPAQEVARIRPLALARRLGLDPDQVVAACLRGSRAGLLSLLWDILCPVCRIPSDVQDTLRSMKEHGRCEACNLDYELDFANSVELIFRVHPDIRPSELAVYCIGGPAHSPHVVAQVRLAPGERVELELSLNEGNYQLRGPQLPWALDFQVEPGAPASRWDVSLSRGLDPAWPRRLLEGRQVLALANDTDQELVARIERMAPRADALTAARASALALFRELYPTEVLAPGKLISVASVTLLVTRLEGGRRLYQDLGDARAFALIHEHFRLLSDRVKEQGGALVKTVGEGIVAAFTQAEDAVRVGLDLQALLAATEKTRDLRLHIGIHSGPTMAATINEHLDYFGTTVTAAEQLLDLVQAGELALTPPVASDPPVAELLASRGGKSRVVAAELPGSGKEPVACLVISGEALPANVSRRNGPPPRVRSKSEGETPQPFAGAPS